MAKRDEGSNPFGWVVLGFVCGVIATLGVLIVYSGGFDQAGGENDAPGAADAAFQRAEPEDAPVVASPRATDPSAAPAPSIAPPAAPSSRPAPAVIDDPQIAEDAAASGMTTRSPRN